MARIAEEAQAKEKLAHVCRREKMIDDAMKGGN